MKTTWGMLKSCCRLSIRELTARCSARFLVGQKTGQDRIWETILAFIQSNRHNFEEIRWGYFLITRRSGKTPWSFMPEHECILIYKSCEEGISAGR